MQRPLSREIVVIPTQAPSSFSIYKQTSITNFPFFVKFTNTNCNFYL